MSELHHPNYYRIWGILCVLLMISIAGPFLGVRIVTLITAFGIAIVKAYLVAKNFMHVNVQPRYVALLLGTSLAFVLLFFSGTAPDVMKAEGTQWEKPSYAYHDAAARGEPHEEQPQH
jgi:caa(3)-type oxidase subunit IV